VVHKLPADLRTALVANATALDAWNDITPLARNEFICWVDDAKQMTPRERRIRRTQEELEEGQRRPCCWPGCGHLRTNRQLAGERGSAIMLPQRPIGSRCHNKRASRARFGSETVYPWQSRCGR
jgi:hypothetical protein